MYSLALVPVDQYLVPSLPAIWFGVVIFCLTAYVALDGFDFGIGMLYAVRTDEAERETLRAAFGPVWDANEVWLVAFGTTLLAAFPPVYADLLGDHYLLSIGIVLALGFRGVALELREHREDERWRRVCDRLFVGGSTLAPILLGALLGSWVFDVGALSPTGVLTSAVLVALSVTSGSAFVASKSRGSLRAAARRSGTLATGVYLLAVVALLAVVLAGEASSAREQLLTLPALVVVACSVAVGVAGPVLARLERVRAWFASTLTLSGLLGALVAVLLSPTIYPPGGYTIGDAVVSPLALNLVTVLGLPVLVLVLWYFKFLYGVFAGQAVGEYAH